MIVRSTRNRRRWCRSDGVPVPFRAALLMDRNQQFDQILVQFDHMPGPLDFLHAIVLLLLPFESATTAVGRALGASRRSLKITKDSTPPHKNPRRLIRLIRPSRPPRSF